MRDDSNQALYFSPWKKRWNLLLLIISLLHHYVTARKISPSFHWVQSLYTHYIEFCHNKLICFSATALLGLSCVSKQMVFAWFAASQGVRRRWLCGCQDSYWNIQSLIQKDNIGWSVAFGALQAWGREGECVYIQWNCLVSSAEPWITSEERMGPCNTAPFLREGSGVLLSNISIFHSSHYVFIVISVLLILEIQTVVFSEILLLGSFPQTCTVEKKKTVRSTVPKSAGSAAFQHSSHLVFTNTDKHKPRVWIPNKKNVPPLNFELSYRILI